MPILEQLAVELPRTRLVWIKKLGWFVPLSGVQPGAQSSSCTCNKMSPSPVKYLLVITVSRLLEGASLPVIPQVLAYLSMCLILNPVGRARMFCACQSTCAAVGVSLQRVVLG